MKFSTFNFQFSSKKGFTLIELLISIALFTTITVIILSIMFIALRATKKSEVIIGIKQDGNYALSEMDRGIRFARTLDDPSDCTTPITQDSVSITGWDYGKTTY